MIIHLFQQQNREHSCSRSQPEISDILPDNGATNVSRTANIIAWFESR